MRNRYPITAILLLCMLVPAKAQNSTANPFSVFGIGEIDYHEYGENAAMGSVSVGLRQYNTYYTGNPATLTSLGRKNTMIGGAMTFKVSDFSSKYADGNNMSGNMQLATVATKVSQKVGMAVGITPFSRTGYNLYTSEYMEGNPDYAMNTEFKGGGSVSKIFLASAYQLTPKLSLGADLSLLYGSVSKKEINSAWHIDELHNVHKIILDGGLQYQDTLSKDLTATVGLVGGYSTKFKMHNRLYVLDGDDGIAVDKTLAATEYKLPGYFGLGFSVASQKGWLVAADYKRQNWSKLSTGTNVFKYRDVNRFSIGASYIPNVSDAMTYLEVIQFQVGASLADYYMKYKGMDGKCLSFTAGAVFPLRNSCNINATMEFGKVGIHSFNKENYFMLTLGITFRDMWYLERQYD